MHRSRWATESCCLTSSLWLFLLQDGTWGCRAIAWLWLQVCAIHIYFLQIVLLLFFPIACSYLTILVQGRHLVFWHYCHRTGPWPSSFFKLSPDEGTYSTYTTCIFYGNLIKSEGELKLPGTTYDVAKCASWPWLWERQEVLKGLCLRAAKLSLVVIIACGIIAFVFIFSLLI